MLKKRTFFLFVLCSALLGGYSSFFIYEAIFGVPILAIIIGVVIAIFIVCIEILFIISLLDEIKYKLLQRDLLIQSLKAQRPRVRWYKYIFWWRSQKSREK